MMCLRSVGLSLALAAGVGAVSAGSASAGVITSPGGGFQVGIDPRGSLFDPNAAIGFRRAAGAFDPIAPGTAREAYGVSAGSRGGFVDPQSSGVLNIAPGTATFMANSATVTSFLTAAAGGNLLQITQNFSFVPGNENVLQIATTVMNVSAGPLDSLFRRLVDFDVGAGPLLGLNDVVNADPLATPLVDASFNNLSVVESANPLVPFLSSTGPGGGIFGPGGGVLDPGAGLTLGLGTLAPGDSTTFSVFFALNQPGQSEAALRAQLQGLGVGFVITQTSSDAGNTNVAALGTVVAQQVPEPGALGLFAAALVGLFAWRRRAA